MKAFVLILLFASLPLQASVTIGAKAPDFSLKGHDGKTYKLSEVGKDKIVVLEWLNHGCPFIKKHYHSKFQNMQKLQKKWTQKGVVWFSVISSAPGKQGHVTEAEARKEKQEKGSQASAILFDPTGEVGLKYGAKTTPHMYVINPKNEVVYIGAIDDKPSTDIADIPGAKNYVDLALSEISQGKAPKIKKSQPYGCSVKYK